jgi:predicted homoserine dehydrogenase-like protein
MDMQLSVGVAGTGFIARGLYLHLARSCRFRAGKVLSRRSIQELCEFPAPSDTITNSAEQFVDSCDVVFDCSGDVNHAAKLATLAAVQQKPMITLNAEFHVTCGSAFIDDLLLTEAEGDQPGSEAALAEDARAMGFYVRAIGSMKRYLDLTPDPAAMQQWADRSGVNVRMVTAFTDGTKVHIEQVLVANGLGFDLRPGGTVGICSPSVYDGALAIGEAARQHGTQFSDYVLSPGADPGVFVVAEHEDAQAAYLQYLRMGNGPLYYLKRDYHLCHLEVLKTIARVIDRGAVLLNNSRRPKYSVAALAKHVLKPGLHIDRGIGSNELRGQAVVVNESENHVPIGLINAAHIVRRVEPGQILEWADVEIEDCPGIRAWHAIHETTAQYNG